MKDPALAWQMARWRHAAPRTAGFALLLLAPALLLLPLGRIPGVSGWLHASTLVSLLFALALAPIVGRESGRPGEWLVWIYQKGASPADHLTARWALDAALGIALISWWCSTWLVVDLTLAGGPAEQISATAVAMVLAFLVAHAFLFAAAACGSTRGSDLLAGLGLVSLLQPALLPALPALLRRAVHWLLPPFPDAFAAGPALVAGHWEGAAEAGAQVIGYVATSLTIGIVALRRWRPGR